MPSLAMIFGAILGGGVMVDYGVKTMKSSFASAPSAGTPAPGAGSVTAHGNDKADIQAAAQKYHVPTWVLWGVYGLETSHGSNVTTSSAGAMGKMQFIPSTAASYNYPMTNTPNAQQTAQQFDAAAHYLSDLLHQTGSWAQAVVSYSGGGYTLSSVQQQGRGF